MGLNSLPKVHMVLDMGCLLRLRKLRLILQAMVSLSSLLLKEVDMASLHLRRQHILTHSSRLLNLGMVRLMLVVRGLRLLMALLVSQVHILRHTAHHLALRQHMLSSHHHMAVHMAQLMASPQLILPMAVLPLLLLRLLVLSQVELQKLQLKAERSAPEFVAVIAIRMLVSFGFKNWMVQVFERSV